MKRLVLLVFAAALSAPAQASPLSRLAKKLRKGLDGVEAPKVAVLSFPYHDGKVSSGSSLVQEKLTTHLVEDGEVTLVERKLLEKVLGEMELGTTGVLDPKTTLEIGKVLGVSAIVTGTLNDLSKKKTEVNARLIDAKTGAILAAKLTSIKRTWDDEPVTPAGPVVRPPDEPGKPKPGFAGESVVQLAILLDTSNSMDGLINQARAQLWKIVNELASAEKDGASPKVEVALYEYGNSTLPRGENWLRQVLPLTSDLDKVSEALFGLSTNGGEEYAGAAIRDAVNTLQWRKELDVYKTIFIAGNEPFTQGPVDFREAIAAAKAKGVVVNTVFCGRRQQGEATQWKAGADLGGGEYLNIDQTAQVAAIVAPQDDEIQRLGAQLNQTYVGYGSGGRAKAERRAELGGKAKGLSAPAAASYLLNRAMFQSKAQYAEEAAADDAASRLADGKEVEADKLPKEYREMDKDEREKALKAKLEERQRIQKRIQELSEQRRKYVADERKKRTAGGPATLDEAILKAVRSQAASKDYRFKD